jgi:hypothetical protein
MLGISTVFIAPWFSHIRMYTGENRGVCLFDSRISDGELSSPPFQDWRTRPYFKGAGRRAAVEDAGGEGKQEGRHLNDLV